MQLYAGSSNEFVQDTVQKNIARKLEDAFFDYYRYRPSPAEVRSWENSLSEICNVMQYARLTDQGIALEYQLPQTSKRLDCLITGHDEAGKRNAVIVELKQWSATEPSGVPDTVLTYLGGSKRAVLHPSRQVGNYQLYLADYIDAFSSGSVNLASCAYLHNTRYSPTDEVYQPRHADVLAKYPVFAGDQSNLLAHYLSSRVGRGRGMGVLEEILESPAHASRQLLDHVTSMIRQQNRYILLDEQQVVFNEVVARVTGAVRETQRVVMIVRGGPGTGKSVVALNLVAELSARGYNAHYATGSKAFTTNLKSLVGPRAAVQFRFFSDYQKAPTDSVDVILCDESHRLWETGNTRFTPKVQQSPRPLIEHVIEAGKVSVFFIDDLQVVRPNEVGSTSLIRDAALKLGAKVMEFELEAQFRCGGSDGFVNWIDNTLALRHTANIIWRGDEKFEFGLVDSVEDLQKKIKDLDAKGHRARLVAGFCWPWSDPNPDGTLEPDVKIKGWAMPWNAKEGRGRLAPGIPTSSLWATEEGGLEQVGCVYTAQGFEFDHVGVIVGRDLRYDLGAGHWVADRRFNEDKGGARRAKNDQDFLNLVKNTYRVLFTRGLKSCHVYFEDEDTRRFFQTRIEP